MIAPRIRPACASLCAAGLLMQASFNAVIICNALILLNQKHIELCLCTGAACASLFR